MARHTCHAFYSIVEHQISAANAKQFHITADCPGVQFDNFAPDNPEQVLRNEDGGTFKGPLPTMLQVKPAQAGCPIQNCVFDTDRCKLIKTTQSDGCELLDEGADFTTVRCRLMRKPPKSSEGTIDPQERNDNLLCLIDGPYGKVNDQRRKVVLDAYKNYYGGENPRWENFNCTWHESISNTTTLLVASTAPVRMRGGSVGVHMNFSPLHTNTHPTLAINLLYRVVIVLAALVVIKEFFKVVIVLGSMAGVQRFRRPTWFIMAVNSPLLVFFMPSPTFRMLAMQSQMVGFADHVLWTTSYKYSASYYRRLYHLCAASSISFLTMVFN